MRDCVEPTLLQARRLGKVIAALDPLGVVEISRANGIATEPAIG